MPPVPVLIVPSMPHAGVDAPALPSGSASPSGAESGAANGTPSFGEALASSMTNIKKKPHQSDSQEEVLRGEAAAAGRVPGPVPAVPAGQDSEASPSASSPIPGELNAAAAGLLALAAPVQPDGGKELPGMSQGLPRGLPGAPLPALGGAPAALDLPAAASAPEAPAQSPPGGVADLVTIGLPDVAASTARAAGPGEAGALPEGLERAVDVAASVRAFAPVAGVSTTGETAAARPQLAAAPLAQTAGTPVATAGEAPGDDGTALSAEEDRRVRERIESSGRIRAPMTLAQDVAAAVDRVGSGAAPAAGTVAAEAGVPADLPGLRRGQPDAAAAVTPDASGDAGRSAVALAQTTVPGAGARAPLERFADAAQSAAMPDVTGHVAARAGPASIAPVIGTPGAAPAASAPDDEASTRSTEPMLQLLALARDVAQRREAVGAGEGDGGAVAGTIAAAAASAGTPPVLHAAPGAGARGEVGPGTPVSVLALPVAAAPAQWAGELEARIHWVAGQNLRAADIRLDPPELGPLQVQVHAHRDGASVHFTTHSALVRDLVEQSLPRLREMLESSGMSLVDVNVAQHGGGRDQREALPARPAAAGSAAHEADYATSSMAVAAPRGLVDAYV